MDTRIITPKQSETGFGYVLGNPISDYACSQKLVDDGVYEYRLIKLRQTAVPQSQSAFRSSVDALISTENTIKSKTDSTVLSLLGGIILSAFTGGTTFFSTMWNAIGASNEINDLAKLAYDQAQLCGKYYAEMVPYKE